MNLVKYGIWTIFLSLLSVSTATAAHGGEESGSLMLIGLFFGFFALIIVFQLIPAILYLAGLVMELLGHTKQKKKKTVQSNI